MKTFIISALTLLAIFMTACNSEKPLTIEEQAAKLNMTMEEYKEAQQKAAQMGMSMDDHMQELNGE
ncbi:MAG: hypothetical protein KBD78_14405 [Oligoflexales bacterium]|nr:hypothetical protein [Oligoflexales bacterium]